MKTYTQSISRIRAGDQVASPMSIVAYVTEGESRRSTHPKLERRRVYSHIVTLTLLSATLIGCQTLSMPPRHPKPQWKTSVQQMTDKEAFLYKPKNVHLSQQQLEKIETLITPSQVTGISVALTAVNTPLNNQRIAALSKYLQQRGIKDIARQSASADDQHNKHVITLRTTRYTVILPQCPGWEEPMGDASPIQGERNFGCTIESNLAKMIDNPRDLVDPTTGSAHAERQLRALKEYYEGKQEKLKVEKPDSSSSS